MNSSKGLDNYLLAVRKLNNMGRWSTEFMHSRTTVSEHSFYVAQVGQMLGLIEEQQGNEIDWGRLFKKLLNHDVVEAITGDIISTVKHKSKEMRDMVSLIEKEAAEESLFAHMEDPYKVSYREILFDGKDDTLEGRILKAADYIDALMECIGEIRLHNYLPFVDKYHSILEKLKKVDLISVRYFVNYILPPLVSKCKEIHD
ncbi:MAG: HD domain-containing protein [Desulfosporosinus sp.]